MEESKVSPTSLFWTHPRQAYDRGMFPKCLVGLYVQCNLFLRAVTGQCTVWAYVLSTSTVCGSEVAQPPRDLV